MNEKRFTITQDFEEPYKQIRDNGHVIMGYFIEVQAETIVNLLNKLNDENNQLKHQRHEDINELAVIAIKYKAIQSENAALEKRIHIYETTLKEAIQNERTHLGHNALKQLAENLGVK